MPHFKDTPLVIVTCLLLCGSAVAVDVAHINDITALTLKADTWTTANRIAPIQQLQCVGGNAMDMAHHVRLVQCVKVGSNGNSNQWKCNANFPDNLPIDLERTDVTCEGYTDRKDPYKVVGSCGLLYTLVRRSHYNTNYQSPTYDYDYADTGGEGGVFATIFIIGLLLWFGSVICGGGGGNRGGGFDGRNNRGEGLSNTASYWSGAATGAAASSLWNSRRNNNRYNTDGSGNRSSTRNNLWSSGGGTGTTRPSSGTRQSTGFGTTIDR